MPHRNQPDNDAYPTYVADLARKLGNTARDLRATTLTTLPHSPALQRARHYWQQLTQLIDDEQFASDYAQTFTYALLLAHVEGGDVSHIASAAAALGNHPVLSSTLGYFNKAVSETRDSGVGPISRPVRTLQRLIAAVDADKLTAADPWTYFYEHFLKEYDPATRSGNGVFYTPSEIVDFQVRTCQEILKDTVGVTGGFADESVTILDPATGTGSYALGVFRAGISDVSARRKGSAAQSLAGRLSAFEKMMGPYAIAHLKIGQAVREYDESVSDEGVKVFFTDTLAAPIIDEDDRGQLALLDDEGKRVIAAEQRRASEVKSTKTQVRVIIGNPPWNRGGKNGEHANSGGVVTHGDDTSGPWLDDFTATLTSEQRGSLGNLYNDYVYFWCWARRKLLQHPGQPGVVSFITASSFLQGPSFAGMRQVLRETFDELWFIDLGGDGKGAHKEENVFNIQTPCVITIAVRHGRDSSDTARGDTVADMAVGRYIKIAGTRAEKLDALRELRLDDQWALVPSDAQEVFLPVAEGHVRTWPLLTEVFPWTHSGLKGERTWPIGENQDVLKERWKQLVSLRGDEQAAAFKETDRTVSKARNDHRTGERLPAICEETSSSPIPRMSRLAYRPFDGRWVLEDDRLISRLRSILWEAADVDGQVFFTTLATKNLGEGPGILATSWVPDIDQFCNRGGKDVMPLYHPDGTPNINPHLTAALTEHYGQPVSARDIANYIVGLLGTPAYSDAFFDVLKERVGAPVPFTGDHELFTRVGALGADIIAMSTRGDADIDGFTGTAECTEPVQPAGAPYPMKSTITYSPDTHALTVGEGTFTGISPQMWNFSVSGYRVLEQWLTGRVTDRTGRKSSPLDDIRPTIWDTRMTEDFLATCDSVECLLTRTSEAAELLTEVRKGDLIVDIATPVDSDRKARRAGNNEQALDLPVAA